MVVVLGDNKIIKFLTMSIITLNISDCPPLMKIDFYDADSSYTENLAHNVISIIKTDGAINTPYSGIISIINNGAGILDFNSAVITSNISGLFERTFTDGVPPIQIYPSNNRGFTVDFAGTPTPGVYTCIIEVEHNDTSVVSPFIMEFRVTIV
jgi:hypothetical protein